MTAILLPSRWTQQPQGAVEVADQNCVFVALGDRGAIGVSSTETLTSTPTFNVPTAHGLALKTDTTASTLQQQLSGAVLNQLPSNNADSWTLEVLCLASASPSLSNYFGWMPVAPADSTTNGKRRSLLSFGGTNNRNIYVWGENADLDTGVEWDISGNITHVIVSRVGSGRAVRVHIRKGQSYTLVAGNLGADLTDFTPGGIYTGSRHVSGSNPPTSLFLKRAIYRGAKSDAECRDLLDYPWQTFRPLTRRIYFDLGAGGTTYNQSLTANASGSASFARAVQAIKSASAASSAVTERLIAIQRSASSTAAADASKQAQLSRSASVTGTATLTSIKTVLQAVTASASGSPALSRMVGMLRSVSSTGSATYSRAVGLIRSVTGTGTATLTGPATTQFLRPDGNVTQTSFTGGFAEIDEASASDADFAYGTNNTAAVLEVSLSNPTGTPASGTTTVRYRIAKTNAGTVDGGGNAVTVTAAVYQGTTLIAADSAQTATGTWTQYSWTPSMASVTDWNDLRLRFTTSASGGTAANRRGGAVSWGEVEAPAGGATIFEQALTATSTAAASLVRSLGRVTSASASGAASFVRAVGKSASAAASGAASYLRDMSLSRSASAAATATTSASRALFATLTASATGTASLATAMAITMTLTAAAAGSATMTAMFGLLIVASATGSASIIRAISLTRAAASAAAAIVQRTVSVTISATSSVVAMLTKLASTAGTSIARMLSISAESRIHTPSAENRIRTLGAEDRDLTE